MDAIKASSPRAPDGGIELLVIGGGPAGVSAGLRAAERMIERIDEVLRGAEQTVADASTTDVPVDVADRIDEALARVQQRVEAGDSLRAIARDERAAAEATAAELKAQADAAKSDARDQLREVEQAVTTAATDELAAARSDLGDIATTLQMLCRFTAIAMNSVESVSHGT